jgi:hypothetical protein
MTNSFNNLDPDTLLDMALPKAETKNSTDEILEEALQKAKLDSVDTLSGAPSKVRALVGAAQTPKDKLATLKQFFPDAQPVEFFDPKNGVARFGSGNFVYTDPETNKLTLFDEFNKFYGMSIPFTARDLLDVGPEVAETVGAIGGAYVGGLTGVPGGPVGVGTGIIAGEGFGAATAREAYIGALDFLGDTIDRRTGMERLLDFGTTATINAMFGPIINKTFNGIKGFVGGGVRYENGVNTPAAETMLQKMEDIGITNPTAGQVTNNPVIQLTEKALASMPLSTKIMQENARQTLEEISQFAANLTYRYGGAKTFQQTGEELLSAATSANKRYMAEADRLYNEAGKLIDDTVQSPAAGISEFANKYIALSKTNALKPTYAPAMEMVARLLKDKEAGNLSYKVLKDFRSSLGKDLADAKFRGAMSGADRKLDALYGYISRDLDALVESQSDAAKQAYKNANDYVKEKLAEGSGNINFVREVINKGKKDATDALDFVLRKKEKTGARLQKLKDELTPEEWEILSGYMIGSMGLPNAGKAGVDAIREGIIDATEVVAEKGFSPATFINNFGKKLSPEAKRVLFGNDTELLKELNNFVDVLNRIAKDAEFMGNPSGTARVYGAMGMFSPSAVGMALEGLGKGGSFYDAGFLSLAAAPGAAKLMTNARFVNWLGQGIEMAAYDPNSLGQHIRRLVQIYELEPEIRDQVQAIAAGHIGELAEPSPEKNSDQTVNVDAPLTNELSFRNKSTQEVASKTLDAARSAPQIPQVNPINMNMFEEPDTSLAMSPTVLPDEKDREIALRQGIGSLT